MSGLIGHVAPASTLVTLSFPMTDSTKRSGFRMPDWSNVIGGLITTAVGIALTTYVAVQVMHTELGLVKTGIEADKTATVREFSNVREWIKRVDDRSQTRHEENAAAFHREMDDLRADIREVRSAQGHSR